jgi:hypothetical protein
MISGLTSRRAAPKIKRLKEMVSVISSGYDGSTPTSDVLLNGALVAG